ncbi:TetR/AcrR family transcriptional regulator [Aquamicrobium sp. LC103]|nr:TetR/AcrR family transcriptional regulator [Aquamicrobium sp. LC103]
MASEGATDGSLPRRQPVQKRSRERLKKILDVAAARIARNGSDQLRMSDVAEGAGVSIGSLYQYFPDKSAIVRALAEHYNAQSRQCIEEALRDVATPAQLEAAYIDLLDQYFAMVRDEPVIRDIWSATQTDKQLMSLELTESRLCAALLADAMARAHGQSAKKYESTAFMIWQLGEAVVRLATSVDGSESKAILEGFKRMTAREILQM